MVADPSSPEIYPPYPGTWQEFLSRFGDEKTCVAYLEQLRWATGFRCPKCEGAKGWQMADGRWSCSGCGRKVSVTAGTIFDRSRIPLQQWFAAAWYMTNQKHGVSALGLQRLLGLGSYQTAWTILQKLRKAMVRPGRDRLCGPVEADETYVGGIAQGVRGRGADCKFIVAIAIEVLSPKGFGRVRLQHVNDVSGASLVPFVSGAVKPSSEVTGGRVTTGYPVEGTDTTQPASPKAEIQPTFLCPGCTRWLPSSNAGCSEPTRDR